MQTEKHKHMHTTSIMLPLQHKDGSSQQIKHTFLLDTGASMSIIPISMLLSSSICTRDNLSKILSNLNKAELKSVSNESIDCYLASLNNVEILGFKVRVFRFAISDRIDNAYAILGSDFIDACTHYHTAASSWDFRSFDSCAYERTWGRLSNCENVNSIQNLIETVLSKQDLTVLSDF